MALGCKIALFSCDMETVNMFFDYPNEQDWPILEASYPFSKLHDVETVLANSWATDDSLASFLRGLEMRDWVMHLANRLIHVRRSYVMLKFYYDKGIPDAEWYISPGKNGESIQYFPHFEEKHFWHKTQFEYYADVFYYKLFSAWDTLGHLLNIEYDMQIERASFHKSITKLKTVNPNLNVRLQEDILKNDNFKRGRDFRDSITHNFLPGHVGSTITKAKVKNQLTVSMGVGNYIPSDEIMNNIINSLDLFTETMSIITEEIVSSSNAVAA